MSCPNCTKHRIIAIGVTIGDDRVTMHSCSHCGTRWWEQEGRPVPLPNVLELAASNR
jgi:transcription elongation factor Elf1